MFKVTVTSKNLTRGVKSRGILLTMNRVLLKIHLYKNEIIREGAQIKRIPTQTCSVSTLTPDVVEGSHQCHIQHICHDRYRHVLLYTQSWSYVPCWNKGHHKGINFSSVAVELLGVLPECRGEALEKHAAKRSHSAAPLSTQPLLLLGLIRHLRAEKNGISDSKKGG